MNVYAMLFLFFGLYISICVWIFLIITDSIRKISSTGFIHVQQDFVEEVDRQFMLLMKNQMVSLEEIHSICKKIRKKRNRRYFFQKFIYFVDRIKDKDYVKEYFKIVFPYLREMIQYTKTIHYSEKSYQLMLLGEFRQDLDEVNNFILKALDDEAFDVRTNALRALSIIGNNEYFNQGLIKACSSQQYFNPRHISEMISSFEGDKEKLRQCMLNSFYENSDIYRQQVIIFFTEYNSTASLEFVMDYIEKELNNKEIIIACIRFFSVCEINQRAKEIITKLLELDDYDIRAIVVKLVPIYFKYDQEILQLMYGGKYLKSDDWYVRRNSAFTLVRMGLKKDELINQLTMEDKYARDALIYAMFEAEMITYEEFTNLGGDMVA